MDAHPLTALLGPRLGWTMPSRHDAWAYLQQVARRRGVDRSVRANRVRFTEWVSE